MTFDLFSPTLARELILLGLALLFSVVIGLERHRQQKSAGLRTHTLVGIGSAVFTLVSAYGFEGQIGTAVVLDPSRIAAQVVSGIGFLGAGVIYVHRGAVSGLTTAASIWVTASIGMACGAGQPTLAFAATTAYVLAVILLSWVGSHIQPWGIDTVLTIEYIDGRGILRDILTTVPALGYDARLTSTQLVERPSARHVEIGLRCSRSRGGSTDELVELVGALYGVVGVATATEE